MNSGTKMHLGVEKLRRILIDVQTIIEKSDISLIGSVILNVPE